MPIQFSLSFTSAEAVIKADKPITDGLNTDLHLEIPMVMWHRWKRVKNYEHYVHH